MMTAVLAVMSQIAIPLPSGVPVTMQTFAVALSGFVLGAGSGALTIMIYLLAGLIGLPVFAGFMGGAGVLIGLPGGFLIGFLPMAFCCGLPVSFSAKRSFLRPTVAALFFGLLGLALCHLFGVCQFAFLSGNSIPASFLLVSAPYLIKDVLSIFGAYLVSLPLRRALAQV